VATPFVQGRLRDEKLSVEVETSCAHCGDKMHLTIDSDLKWSVKEDASPMIFRPDVDFHNLKDPSIIDAF
jgi:hypothetical protein